MTAVETIRRQVAIAGRVVDSRTGRPLGNARVTIVAGPPTFTAWLAVRAIQYGDRWATIAERPDRTRAARDGHFHFVDLPDGTYTLAAAMPGAGSRHGSADREATVSRDADGNIARATVELSLPPTTLTGHIAEADTGDPVRMAEVRVTGSGERAFSDGQGRYLLAGLETGNRGLAISAVGYQPVSRTVTLAEVGAERSLDVTLTPSPA